MFAQTEASPIITQTRLDDTLEDRARSLGRPLPETEVKIVDPATGATVPRGAIGELCTRGYHVMHGYFDNLEATAAAIDGEAWLHTGDLCSMDERGYCHIEGRLKDMIIRGGENIYPREIEQLLFRHSGVADVAVVGVPDPKWGELEKCCVVDRVVEPDHGSRAARSRAGAATLTAPEPTPDGLRPAACRRYSVAGTGHGMERLCRTIVWRSPLAPGLRGLV